LGSAASLRDLATGGAPLFAEGIVASAHRWRR
jgi:hypothetical protein